MEDRMRGTFHHWRTTFACAVALLAALVLTAPVLAQETNPDGSVNPTARSVQEQQLLQELQEVQGRITIPDSKARILIQPEGRNWRQFHEVTLPWMGAIAILGFLLILVAFYLWRGMLRIQGGRSGIRILRFNAFERAVHWMTAVCFIILAISGLNITFGEALLYSLLGPEAFTAWSQWAKYAHNYLSFPFTLGVVLIFLMWIAGNIPNRADVQWVKEGGGILDPSMHPPAWRFNAGQKVIYWIVVLGGAAVAVSGYILMFPFYETDIADMQLAQMVHGIVAVLFVAVMLGHIYIGTLGMEGAFEAMGEGSVDLNWAKQHHPLWVAREGAGERRVDASGSSAGRSAATPAE
jgi:formate dehydrogenase subunit gamma